MTHDEWERALCRAWSEGIFLVDHPDKPGISRCYSQTLLRQQKFVVYEVGLYGCTCPARRPCKHRALWLFEHPDDLPLAVLPALNGDADSEQEELIA